MKKVTVSVALAVLLSSCSGAGQERPDAPALPGVDEIVRIEGSPAVGFGHICEKSHYALDFPTREFLEALPYDDAPQKDGRINPKAFEYRATLTPTEIEGVREHLGGDKAQQLITQLEESADESRSRDDSCQDGASASLRITYQDGTERNIVTGYCGIDGPNEALALLNILPKLGDEYGFTFIECEARMDEQYANRAD